MSSRRVARATTGGGDGNEFSANLLKIVRAVEELGKDTDGLQPYAKLVETQVALKQGVERMEKEIQEKDEELHRQAKQKDEEISMLQNTTSKLKEFEQGLDQKYHTQFRTWNTDSKRLSTALEQISGLEGDLKMARKATEDANQIRISLANQIQRNSDLEENLVKLRNKHRRMELELEDKQSSLEECQKRLKTTNSELGIVPLDSQKV
jgi:chromosome segregation ATPase